MIANCCQVQWCPLVLKKREQNLIYLIVSMVPHIVFPSRWSLLMHVWFIHMHDIHGPFCDFIMLLYQVVLHKTSFLQHFQCNLILHLLCMTSYCSGHYKLIRQPNLPVLSSAQTFCSQMCFYCMVYIKILPQPGIGCGSRNGPLIEPLYFK